MGESVVYYEWQCRAEQVLSGTGHHMGRGASRTQQVLRAVPAPESGSLRSHN